MRLQPSLRKTHESATEKGALNWLMVLPLEDEGYVLHREEFYDAISIGYDLPITGLPSRCPCSQKSNRGHAMNCKKEDLFT